MTLNPNKELKKFYSISELAGELSVNESLLRYWEEQIPQIHPKKTPRGVRQYSQADRELIHTIYYLVKIRGLHISAAHRLIRKNRNGMADTAKVVQKLTAIRAQLAAIRTALNHVAP